MPTVARMFLMQALAPACALLTVFVTFSIAVAEESAAIAARTSCNCGEIPTCCPALGEFHLAFGRVFTGSYRTGEPFDVLTAIPDGSGSTFAESEITLRVQIVCSCPGVGPLAGIPASEILLFDSRLCHCAPYLIADHDTDADGWTEFSGAIPGGGCAPSLALFVDGVGVGTFPIQVNSPDNVFDAGQCGVDAGDLAAVAARLGVPESYSVCFDYNEDGAVDAGDVGAFAQALGRGCRQ